MKSPKPEFGMSFQDAGSELAACTTPSGAGLYRVR